MSTCALEAAAFFLADIGALPYSITVGKNVATAVDTYNQNKPKNSVVDIAVTLESCAQNSITNSLTTDAITIAIIIGAIIIIMILCIIGTVAGLGVGLTISAAILFVVAIVSIIILYFYLSVTDINIGSCISNATRSIEVYQSRTDTAINSGLCAY